LLYNGEHITILRFSAILLFSLLVTTCGSSDSIPEFTISNTGPYILNVQNLEVINNHKESDSVIQHSFSRLIVGADSLLNTSFEFVTDKPEPPPGGTKNDYMSIHRYWHQNPDGEPYYDESISNALVEEYDRPRLARFSSAVYTLSLAYFFSGNEKYAEKAAELLKGWFLEPETRMNPQMDYAQIQIGTTDTGGGGTQGIIDANDFINVIEAVSLLYDSHHWSGENHKTLKEWFYHFSEWILKNYNADAFSTTNISTWMDGQRASYFLFTEQEGRLNSNFHIPPVSGRIESQFSEQGTQIYESGRARSQHYVYYNLRGYMNLANMRKNRSGNDRDWQVLSSGNHGGLKPAIDNLVTHIQGNTGSTFFERDPNFDECRYLEIFRPAAIAFHSYEYDAAASQLLNNGCINSNIILTYPSLELITNSFQ
jgi:hypothetical protein